MPIQHYQPDPTQCIYPTTFPTCPVCNARAGAYCRRPSGHSGPFVAPHSDRTKAARLEALRVAARTSE